MLAPQGESDINFFKAIRAGARASQFTTQLRERFVRQPKSKAFVGWQSYYRAFLEESPGRALVDHRGPYVGDELRQTELINAMDAGKKLFLVSAPPGCGKSRFALELARRLGKTHRSWDVRFVRPDEPTLEEELRDLRNSRQVLLIVDDAHHCPAVVQQLASVCADAQPDAPIHLVCLTQPTGRAVLIEALASRFPLGEPLHMDLGRPQAKLVRELIDKLIPQLSPHHRDVIRRFVGDSFFVTVLLCSSVARQKNLPQTLSTRNMRDFAIRQPVAAAIRDLCPVEKACRALAVYAACVPVRSGDAAIRACAATLAGLSSAEIETLEQRVLEAGLFQQDARGGMRAVPDLVGDLILEETCLNEQGQPTPFGQALIRGLFEQQKYEPVIRNCGDIARLFSTPARVDFLSDLVLERANTVSTPSQAAELLHSCGSLAVRQPGAIVRLVDALSAKGVLRVAPSARELKDPDSPEVRAQWVLASAGEHDSTVVARALEYSRRLLVCARADAETYLSLREKVAASCRFAVARPLAHATAVIDVLKGWSEGAELEAAELAASLVQGFLQLEMFAHRWEEGALTAMSVSLDPTDEIWKLRDRALDILVRCSRHAEPTVQYAAADSLRYWAQGYANLSAELRESWAPQLNREMESLAESFSKLGAVTTHLPVRAALEHQGWRWWLDGAQLFMQRGGKRMLEALPESTAYPLWKALHDAALPIFPVPLDESIEVQHRRERLLAVIEPAAERVPELAKGLFDRLDSLCNSPAAWSKAFTDALSALPRQTLQPHAHLYLAEFVRRHSAEGWALISEDTAQGPLGAILPTLLVELRRQDLPRWHEAIRRALPGTRLFEVELGALCAADELDDVEREMVSKGLELEDAEAVHLSAQALLNATRAALAPGLAAAFAVLPRRPTDERLWELTLDAFARWGEHILAAPEGEEAGPEIRTPSGELLRLLRAYGNSLSWKQGPHTRRLATVMAIFAVAIPHTLKSWLRELWSPSVDHSASELPLSMSRMAEVVRLVAKSPTGSYWQKQFAEWMTDEPDLAIIGARSLAQLWGLADPGIVPVITRVVQQPTAFALDALNEFVASHRRSPRFIEDVLTLLQNFVASPETYSVLEKELISAMAREERAGANSRSAVLDAIDNSMRNPDLAAPLRDTLDRARQAVQAAIEEDLLGGEAR